MKNITKIFSLGMFLLFAFSFPSKSDEIPVELAQSIAMQVAKTNFPPEANANELYKIKRIQFYPDLSPTAIYIVDISPAGFVLVSNEDNTYPVLGYSSKNYFNAGELPTALSTLIKSYSDQIDFIRKKGLEASDEIKSNWEYYCSNTAGVSRAGRQIVEPLISTTWNQNRYYNHHCPVDSNVFPNMNYHVPAGCFPVAMAQVMKYYAHPVFGTGQHSYMLPEYGEMSADFENPGYNYSNMPAFLEEENEDLARLIYHCGVSLTTSYGTFGSLAFISDIKAALVSYFKYQDDIAQVYRNQYTDMEWKNLLKEELENSRPVIYRGTGTNGVHGWVCDGYDAEGLFHMNWGWGGSFDGYFEMSDLHPGGYIFNEGHKALINITPLISGHPELSSSTIKVFPNPVREKVYISISEESIKSLNVSIIDLAGKTILQQGYQQQRGLSSIVLNLAHIADGVYLLQVQNGQEVFSTKLIKQ
ncbi:MAG: C10 family peptidase [Bacteroidota bacterium]|nr:C10 family peptidase [Bacteroidota bacterium]